MSACWNEGRHHHGFKHPKGVARSVVSQLMEIFPGVWPEDKLIREDALTYTSKHELGSLLDLWLYDGMDLDENKFMNRMLWKVWRVQALEFHKTSLYVRYQHFPSNIIQQTLASTGGECMLGHFWCLHVGGSIIASFMDGILYCYLIYTFGLKMSKAICMA